MQIYLDVDRYCYVAYINYRYFEEKICLVVVSVARILQSSYPYRSVPYLPPGQHINMVRYGTVR